MPDRTLTDVHLADYQARFAAAGLTFWFEPTQGEPYGFGVQRADPAATFGYRFQEGDTATDLLDRILSQLG